MKQFASIALLVLSVAWPSVAQQTVAPVVVIRQTTLPANIHSNYHFRTMTLKPPDGDAWRLLNKSRNFSWLSLYHLHLEAVIGVFWMPRYQHGSATDPAEAVREFFREHFLETMKLDPDVKIVSAGAEETMTIADRTYQTWRHRLSYKKKKKEKETEETSQFLVLATASPTRPDMFVFFVSMPEREGQKPDVCEGTLWKMIRDCEFVEYPPESLALPRAVTACRDFLRIARLEGKERDAARVLRARENAVGEIEGALRFIPHDARVWNLRGSVSTFSRDGLEFGEGFDAKRAEESFRKAITLQPTFLDAWENLAQLLETTGRVDEAEAAWKTAITIHPSKSENMLRLARFYAKRDRLPEAIEMFDEALRFWLGKDATREEVQKEVSMLRYKLRPR